MASQVDPVTATDDSGLPEVLRLERIEDDLFRELFGDEPRLNEEGRVLAARTFDAGPVEQTVRDEPMQAAGAALLRLAWTHRARLDATR